MIPIRVRRCPFVPANFRRAACYKRCIHWDRKNKECRYDVQRHTSEKHEKNE